MTGDIFFCIGGLSAQCLPYAGFFLSSKLTRLKIITKQWERKTTGYLKKKNAFIPSYHATPSSDIAEFELT